MRHIFGILKVLYQHAITGKWSFADTGVTAALLAIFVMVTVPTVCLIVGILR
jgi:hypothetical protein